MISAPLFEIGNTTSRALYDVVYNAILPTIKDNRECKSITIMLLQHYLNINTVDTLLNEPFNITIHKRALLTAAIERLKNHEPIQYVLREAYFFGRIFTVTPEVLIPRPETEDLVRYVIKENPHQNIRVLDIGTGSGCIGITLQLELLNSIVHVLDISQNALDIATANAEKLGATLYNIHADILNSPLPEQKWNIIISNPPYVRISEQKYMHARVLDYEPELALFVPDNDPLIFYKKIALIAAQHLLPHGKIYLEINEAFGLEVSKILVDAGFCSVILGQDIHGKNRWVSGMLGIDLFKHNR